MYTEKQKINHSKMEAKRQEDPGKKYVYCIIFVRFATFAKKKKKKLAKIARSKSNCVPVLLHLGNIL